MPRLLCLSPNRFASVLPVVVALCLFAVGASACAQGTALPPVPQPAFPKLFPKYTGVNGYEDIVMAADLLLGNPMVQVAQNPDATLKDMRRALDDPNIDRALQLVRNGLNKPVQSPRDPDKLDENTLLPEYSGIRELGRLIAVQEYVFLADGQVPRAIDAMREGLRLGYIIQGETLLSGLVGIAIDSMVLEKFAGHFDQLALRDCANLIALAQEWLKMPSRMEVVLTMEHQSMLNMLSGWKDDPERLRAVVKMMQPKDAPTSDSDLAALELSAYVNSQGAAIPAMLDQTRAIADTQDRVLIEETRKPAWQRKPFRQLETRGTMASRLYGLVSPTYSPALGKFDAEAARIHLLGIHAAIRKFRWENNRLPTSLSELKLPVLSTDPFTGAPLVYKVSGANYELNSAGPSGGDATAGNGPVYLPRKTN